MHAMDITQSSGYVVGQEKRLVEIIAAMDIMPLVKAVIQAGAAAVLIIDEDDHVLWSCGAASADSIDISLPLYLEGEAVGALCVKVNPEQEKHLRSLAELLRETLGIILVNNLKMLLTSEMHTTVISRSYDELLEINRQLSISERKYRELAENLELKVAERTEELNRAHCKLLQQEKMASIGQLAAGVAHEINNPLGFISSNLQTMGKYVARFNAMLDFFRTAIAVPGDRAELVEAANGKWRELKIDTVRSDAADLVSQSLEGTERVKRIVSDLKGFSHLDDVEQFPADLNNEIDKTLSVLSHEITEGTAIIRSYKPLPAFTCNPALLCQVFLNLILNALQLHIKQLRLEIATGFDGENIRLTFADNGPGIAENIKNRIFDPFYTTKDVGSGTGMGLTVAYDIVKGYGGTIEVNCPAGGGSIFVISLPINRGQ
jgi:two-component system, NtrC family, sensor kinase